MPSFRQLALLSLLAAAVTLGGTRIVAQQPTLPRQPTKVSIDESILAAFVDEPCRHFEAARDQFVARQFPRTAEHLRTASAYLRLEAARADAQQRAALDASVRELQRLAVGVERNQVRSVETLQAAFAQAHYALASHHCVKSAHRCCRKSTFADKDEMIRAGHDLRAATIHVERGLQWAGEDSDEETRNDLLASQLTAQALIRNEGGSQNDMQRILHRMHGKLENLTGRKIRIARPLTPGDDRSGPSIFK